MLHNMHHCVKSRHSVVEHLLLPDHVFGIVFPHMSITVDLSLEIFRRKLKTYLTVQGTSARDCAFRSCVQIFLLTYF